MVLWIVTAAKILFCVCFACHTAQAQQPIEQSSSAGGPSPHVPSLKTPAVPSVDLSDIPDGTLGKWLCVTKEQHMSLINTLIHNNRYQYSSC